MSVQTIVVVMAAAVLATVAHVSDEYGVRSSVHENATTGVAVAHITGDGPKPPGFINYSA
jgi:hypothetical protein